MIDIGGGGGGLYDLTKFSNDLANQSFCLHTKSTFNECNVQLSD